MQRFFFVPLLLASLWLSGCIATALVGGGAAAGSAAFDQRSVGRHIDDDTLETKISVRMAAEKDLPSRWVSVDVINGKVLLTGYLPRQDQIDRAIWISRSFKGVKSVRSDIKLGKPTADELASDSWITAQVKSKLVEDPDVSAFTIHLETVAGKVYLLGVVKNAHQRYQAASVAKKVKGVKSIENLLTIDKH
ncbi:MAG TPA: BON domain-containing protein [Mariprofundaceae bacterium]|nr:BON domain-containing protein [Mariprofundaceae bacterium]